MPALRHNGIALMATAATLYSAASALAKFATVTLPSPEVVFFRSLIMAGLILAVALWRGERGELLGRDRPLLVLRGLLGSVGLLLFFYALSRISVGDTLLVFQTTPLFVAIAAFLVLRERLPASFFAVLALALGGVALIVRPSWDFVDPGALAALGAAVASGGAYTAVRKLRGERRKVVVLYFATLAALVSLPLALLAGWAWPGPLVWLALGGVGVLSAAAQLLMTEAYALDKAGRVALAGYTGPAVAVVLDLVFWGVVPPWTTGLGGVLVIGALVWLNLQQDGEPVD